MLLATLPSMCALRQIVAVHWRTRRRLSLLPDARVSRILGLMGRPVDAKLTPDVAAEVCERTASVAVVEGSITSLGNEYVLSLRARNCRTGDILDQQQGRAARKEDVFKTLGQMAKRFGNRAADSLPPWKIAQSAGRGNHILTGGLEVIQRGNEGVPGESTDQRKPSRS